MSLRYTDSSLAPQFSEGTSAEMHLALTVPAAASPADGAVTDAAATADADGPAELLSSTPPDAETTTGYRETATGHRETRQTAAESGSTEPRPTMLSKAVDCLAIDPDELRTADHPREYLAEAAQQRIIERGYTGESVKRIRDAAALVLFASDPTVRLTW